MLQLIHKQRIVEACYPETKEDALALWHDIKPVKFGNSNIWLNTPTTPQLLASYQVPEDAAYLLILRVECYATTFVATAPGFGLASPPPDGTAFWAYNDVSAAVEKTTSTVPIHLLCDTDELLFAAGGSSISLQATLIAPPDGNQRLTKTLVYGYLVGALVAGKIGDSESTYWQG